MPRDIALTLAGGGNRAFFQAGLLRHWWARLEPRVAVIASCSAGSSMAVSLMTGREREATAFWYARRAHVTRNIEWRKLFRGQRPTPHTPVYRDTLRHSLAEGGFDRLRAAPCPVLVLTAMPPRWLPGPAAVVVGMAAYSLERKLRYGKLHPGSGRLLGFRPQVFDLRECPSIDAVIDVVVASSATPPFTPLGRHNGSALLDGGLVDNAPAFLAEGAAGVRKHLVILTRPYPAGSVGRKGIRWYLCPGEPVPVNRWEYTRPDQVEATIALGEREALRRDAELEAFLDAD